MPVILRTFLFSKKITVNKYDVLIREFLILNKFVSLEKIGTLTLNANAASSDDSGYLQQAVFAFQHDKKAITTTELIGFIAAKTGKKKSLIDSDLASYFEQIREFINIGKPYEIEGVGILKGNKIGEYEFFLAELRPDQSQISKVNRRDTRGEQAIVKKRSGSFLNALALLILLAVLAALGWWAYQYFTKGNFSSWEEKISNDSTNNANGLNDTTTALAEPVKPDSLLFKYIFDTAVSLKKVNAKLTALHAGGRQIMYDSIEDNGIKAYRLFIEQKTLPADTTAIKDSLENYFKKKISIEISHP